MASFEINGKTRLVNIDIGTIRRIRKNVVDKDGKPVDLLDIINDNLAFRLIADPVLLADIVWNCTTEGSTSEKEAFESAFTGEVIEKALNAFVEAFTNFFPNSQKAQVKRILELAQQVQTISQKALEDQVRTEAEKMNEPV